MTDPLIARLRDAGCVFAEDEAAEIRRVHGDDHAAADAVAAQRALGRPLEQVLSVAVFAGVEVQLADGVFVPRRRAEALVDEALRARPEARVVVDLVCGCGPIAAALARRLPDADVHAVDIDDEALACARVNADVFGFAVHAGDWWSALPSTLTRTIDLAVAYLPQVPHASLADIPADFRDHEPERSVAGGPDGLDPLRAVLRDSASWMSSAGLIVTLVAEEQFDLARRLAPPDRLRLVIG